jgi:predicted NAD/FAD-binding protein
VEIAIIGSGISGLLTSYLLSEKHKVVLYESNNYLGGHTNTVIVDIDDTPVPIDTGFIVYNEANYPNFSQLLSDLEVNTQPSSMGFSVKLTGSGLEYNGSSLNQLFAQRRNLLRPSFYRMIYDVLRFNKEAPKFVISGPIGTTLGQYVADYKYSKQFVYDYLIPMGAAIWSTPPSQVLEMPATFFIQFFNNHGMLSVNGRPQWRTITGGSSEYVQRIITPFRDTIRLNHKVNNIERLKDRVIIDGDSYDHVVLACHSDQCLKALSDPSERESDILSKLPYQKNEVTLHNDTSILPQRKGVWAAWNYHLKGGPHSPVAVTYNMNILQGLDLSETICVTLNSSELIDPERVIGQYLYSHPQFSPQSVETQQRWAEISGVNRTHYCGAYWGNGFHEDGVNSAIRVASTFKMR